MRVRLLGTGSADGWPNPFCGCRSCHAERDAGRYRAQTAALVDDQVLIDCGSALPSTAGRLGIGLAEVTDLFITHDHPDHNDPALALWRSWSPATTPLRVHGPVDALARWQHWIGPDDPVTLHPIVAGTTRDCAGLAVTALAAAHGDEALLYRISDGRHAALYAIDTGPLPTATVDALAGGRLDLLLLELTFGSRTDHGTDHLDLVTFPEQLRRLRAVGALDSASTIAAIHLSHHNPPTPELAALLSRWGATVPDDGALLTVAPATAAGVAGSRSRRTLILGGARSGKSHAAEQLLAAEGAVTYLATGGERSDDADWQRRVAAHRARRPAHWQTVESTDLVGPLAAAGRGDALLIDCLSLWTTALIDEADGWRDAAAAEAAVSAATAHLCEALRGCPATVVVVSNEVGQGVVPATAAGRLFRDQLGRVNTAVAAAVDEVLLVTAGVVQELRAHRGHGRGGS
jgi:adenosylcobinamide kinase/adenosylcobinamide-phosphate guanylyltransferase